MNDYPPFLRPDQLNPRWHLAPQGNPDPRAPWRDARVVGPHVPSDLEHVDRIIHRHHIHLEHVPELICGRPYVRTIRYRDNVSVHIFPASPWDVFASNWSQWDPWNVPVILALCAVVLDAKLGRTVYGLDHTTVFTKYHTPAL